jgi:hypothetical protein
MAYQVVSDGAVEVIERATLRDWIRGGQVTDSTLISPDGVESWKSAGEYPELRHYFDIAGQKAPAAPESDVEEQATVSRARLITYLGLAGLTGGFIMMILGPLCMVLGGMGHDLVVTGAFGGVIGLGINSATKESNPRLIQLAAAGFAAGGLLAWILPVPLGEFGFTPVHLAVIGICGTAALAWALKFTLRQAIPMVIAAAILFPLSFALDLARHTTSVNVPVFYGLGILALLIVRFLPFAMFGAGLGVAIAVGSRA